MSNESRRWVMAKTPGAVLAPDDFELRSFIPRELLEGDVRVRVRAHTVAPGARAAMTYASYGRPMKPGDPMLGEGIGVVDASRHPDFAVGDTVTGNLGWATDVVLRGGELRTLEPALYGDDLPPETALGALGVNGNTAYVGLFEVGRLKAGETVLVSSAAGAVGYLAGQMAVIAGCDVVGIAGSDAKCRELTEKFGFHAAINYRTAGDLAAAIKTTRPDGIDVFFDNVGGRTLSAGVANLRQFGRAPAQEFCIGLGTRPQRQVDVLDLPLSGCDRQRQRS